jgi:RNA polymerase sigma-70 factor, ECF subfamily
MSSQIGRTGTFDLGSTYDRLAPSLYRYALMILADRAAAEDVVHDVFVALVATNRPDAASDAYVRQSVRNACFSLLRRRKWQPSSHVDQQGILEAAAGVPDQADARLALEQALRALPPDQREVVHLKVYEGLTFQEIADLTGQPINTAASRYRYAMDKLRSQLTSEWPR